MFYTDHRKHKINIETTCAICSHREVCSHDMIKLCDNYLFGDSRNKGCYSCTNSFARYDKEKQPCFLCHRYDPEEDNG